MTNLDIVNKLIGKIRPVGKSEVDAERFENLKEMCVLAANIINQIELVAHDFKDFQEASIIKCANYAKNFLTNEIGIKYETNC